MNCSRKSGLTEAADRRLKTFSGGMRKRLDLASSLVSDPKVLVPGRTDYRVGSTESAGCLGIRETVEQARDDNLPHDSIYGRGRPIG